MTVNLHEAIDRRAHAADDYGLAEREFQAQYEFSGKIGVLPAEAILSIPFAIYFVGDPGNQRDSGHDRPQVKLSVELLFGPPGLIPYHYVSQWKQDPDFNFIGAEVKVGVHNPGLSIDGQMPTSFHYKGILHATFQGYGAPWDPDGPFDGGGTFDDAGLS